MRLPGLRLVTTSVIVGEIYTYLVKLDGFGVARTTVRNLSSSSVVTIYQVDAGFDRDIWAAIDEFAGVPLSYADASLVVLGRRLRVRSVFSFDDDLRQAGLDLIPSA